MELKLENGYYIDNNNNKWNAKAYNENEALQHSKGLINCFDCVDCINCKDCRACVNCIDCINCKDCDYCINCKECIDVYPVIIALIVKIATHALIV